MKAVLLIVPFAISLALGQNVSSVEAKPTECYESCMGFAEHLKSSKVKDPIDAAREYCSGAKIKCDDVTRFAKLTNIFVRAGMPMKRACQSKKFCPTTKRVQGGAVCDTCLIIVKMIDEMIKVTNATVDEIVAAVNALCKELSPLKIQSKICADVTAYVRKIVQYILEKMKPGKICIELKLCKGVASARQSEIVKQISELLPFVSRKLMESRNDLPYLMKRIGKLGMTHPNVKSRKSCTICKFVANIVSYSIQFSNSSVTIISATIAQFCSMRPEHEKEMCLAYIAKADKLASYIEQRLTPDDACKQLELCPARPGNIFKGAELVMTNEKKAKKTSGKVSCKICKTVVDIVNFSLQYTNSTITAVEQAIRMFCNTKSRAQKEQCLAYLEKIDLIVQYVERKVSPGNVCVQLGVCPNTRSGRRHNPLQMPSERHQKVVKSVCRACSKYENFIQKMLKGYKASSAGMRDVVAATCGNSATPTMQEKCLMIAPVLATTDGIVNKMLDEKVCRKTLCSNGFFVFSSFIAKRKTDECDMCKYGFNFHVKELEPLRQAIKDNFGTANAWCVKGKAKELSAECKIFVDRTESLIKDFIKEAKSMEVCKRMELCKPKSQFSFANFWKSLSGDLSPCGICKATVEAARKGPSIEGMDKSLSSACNSMKAFGGDKMCKTILQSKGGIAKLREKNKSPEEICQQFNVCGKARNYGEIISGVFKGLKDIFG